MYFKCTCTPPPPRGLLINVQLTSTYWTVQYTRAANCVLHVSQTELSEFSSPVSTDGILLTVPPSMHAIMPSHQSVRPAGRGKTGNSSSGEGNSM